MCEPCVDALDLETEWNSLDGLVCVNTIRTDTVAEKRGVKDRSRVICTLWCGLLHPPGDLRQPSVKCNLKVRKREKGHKIAWNVPIGGS